MPTDPKAPAAGAASDPAPAADRTLVADFDALVSSWGDAADLPPQLARVEGPRTPDGRTLRRRADRTAPAPHLGTLVMRAPVGHVAEAPEPVDLSPPPPARAGRDHTQAYGRSTSDHAQVALHKGPSAEQGIDADPTVALTAAELARVARRIDEDLAPPSPDRPVRHATTSLRVTPSAATPPGRATLSGRPAFESQPAAAPPVQSLTSHAVAGAAVRDGEVQQTLTMAAAPGQDSAPRPELSHAALDLVAPPARPGTGEARPGGQRALRIPLDVAPHGRGAAPALPPSPPVPLRPRTSQGRVRARTDGPLVRSPKLQPRKRGQEAGATQGAPQGPEPVLTRRPGSGDPTEPTQGAPAPAPVHAAQGPAEPSTASQRRSQRAPTSTGVRSRAPASPSSSASVRPPTSARARAVLRDVRVALGLVVAVLLAPGLVDGAVAGPWRLLASPGSANFVAAGFLVLLGSALLAPLSALARAAALSVLGLGLTVFGLLLTGSAVSSGGFLMSEAASAAFIGPPGARMVLVVAACALPTALMWRALGVTRGVGPRIAAGAALLAVCFAYVSPAWPSGRPPIVALAAALGAGGHASLVSDRVAALLALLPVLGAAWAAIVFVPTVTRRSVRAAADVFRVTVMLPLLALALLSAPAGAWAGVLLPLQVVGLCGAGYLLLTTGVGDLLAQLGRA